MQVRRKMGLKAMIQIHGGHDRGVHTAQETPPRLLGKPRLVAPGVYEWDEYELMRYQDGTLIYLWVETCGFWHRARVKGMQPVRPK